MAKKSVVNRDKRRRKTSDRLRARREQLRETISNINVGSEERWAAGREMQTLPRDSSPTRRRNRCKLCGRPRAYNRLTGLCRLHMRIATINGMVPGMHKASW